MDKRFSHPITITLPPKLFKIADQLAEKEGRTRSELFREALRCYIGEKSWERLQHYGSRIVRQRGFKEKDIERLVDEYRI
jgi:metal-responsive CopG/Arc/MetJ family transcriptional regulator